MTQTNIIDLLIIACGGLLVWALAVTLALWDARKELSDVLQSREDLRENLSEANYHLHVDIMNLQREKRELRKGLMAEIYDLSDQLHELEMERNAQSNG